LKLSYGVGRTFSKKKDFSFFGKKKRKEKKKQIRAKSTTAPTAHFTSEYP
jgi:hypothetical protein